MAKSRDYWKAELARLKGTMSEDEQKRRFDAVSHFYKGKLAHMLNDDELSKLGKQAQQRELKRQVDILSGNKERDFARLWKRNMVEALEGIGANSKLIWDFKRNVKIDDIVAHYEEYSRMSDIFTPYSGGVGETGDETSAYDQFLMDYQDWYNKTHETKLETRPYYEYTDEDGKKKKKIDKSKYFKIINKKNFGGFIDDMYGYRDKKATERRIIESSPRLSKKLRARQDKRELKKKRKKR